MQPFSTRQPAQWSFLFTQLEIAAAFRYRMIFSDFVMYYWIKIREGEARHTVTMLLSCLQFGHNVVHTITDFVIKKRKKKRKRQQVHLDHTE